LVAILNADSEGFLRSETALLQTVGRAARNINGKAIFYASRITGSMQRCMEATSRRRQKQLAYNEEFGRSSKSTIGSSMLSIFDLLKEEIEQEQPLEIVGRADPVGSKIPQELRRVELPVSSLHVQVNSTSTVITDHLPSKPGVYFWKDSGGNILYIGKAKKIRSRVKSYLSPSSKHTPRIHAMLSKATSIDYMITPSERDALVLESNLIKHHQPDYNILLKDDVTYPYICASIGDTFPRFYAVPRRQLGQKASMYRYFGPYPQYNEINQVLSQIEDQYDLRATSFAARHGDGKKQDYRELFDRVMEEVFESSGVESSMASLRKEYEEASMLFDSPFNTCRDVVAIHQETGSKDTVIHVVQLREGIVAGRFTYACTLPDECQDIGDLALAIEIILIRQHYPSGEETAGGSFQTFSFFPDEILLKHPLKNASELKKTVKSARAKAESNRSTEIKIRHVAKRAPRRETDERAMEFATTSATQAAEERKMDGEKRATKTSVDGTALAELVTILSLPKPPTRIECYDISHTQGEVPVGSRVVFVDGKPSPALYRKFNIKTVEGVDDYASLEEVLNRRFNRVWVDGEGGLVDQEDPWAMPDLVVIDGGIGQLGAAIKGMAKASVYPYISIGQDGDDGLVEEEVLVDGLVASELAEHTSRTTSVPICALAKKKEEVFVYGNSAPVNTLPDSAALLLLRSLRDESHRFALSGHRKRRSSKLME